eukprot:447044_1
MKLSNSTILCTFRIYVPTIMRISSPIDDNLICKENRKESKMRPMRRKRKRMNQYLESSDGYSTDNALNTNNAHVLKRKRRRLNVTRNVTRNVPKQKMKNQWKKKENKIRDQRNRIEELEAKMDQLLSEKKKRYYKKGAQKKRYYKK